MTEVEWLKANDPDAMLALVAPHLSPRRWHLLACAFVRRVWDLLADDRLRGAVEWAERHAGVIGDRPDEAAELLAAFRAGALNAMERVREAQRAVVQPAEPDAGPAAYRHHELAAPNPSFPLFEAAVQSARDAVQSARDAAALAADAAALLLADARGPARLERVRDTVVRAARVQAGASLRASLALKLRALGDEYADRDTARHVRYAAAAETARREATYSGHVEGDLLAQKQRADRRALGRLLHDLCGNPFRRVRIAPAWRTATVVGLASAIDHDGAFERLPILADALLDADCDAEAVLRHCRGTEPHAPDASHARGCWVIDLILGREPIVFVGPAAGRRVARRRTR